jgi:hypothetical protein
MLENTCPFLFGADIPPDHQERIDRYTRELADKLEQVALAALKDRRPATLSRGQTQAGFAANRRPQSGPVDHDLPVVVARDRSGKIRALWASYACHCTTMADVPNHIPGEVVVDYALRLKKEYDPARLWVNAYANDVPCYIPSKRVWTEGGYEGGDAMIYYDRPVRFNDATEELIISAVHDLLPAKFLAAGATRETSAASR